MTLVIGKNWTKKFLMTLVIGPKSGKKKKIPYFFYYKKEKSDKKWNIEIVISASDSNSNSIEINK